MIEIASISLALLAIGAIGVFARLCWVIAVVAERKEKEGTE